MKRACMVPCLRRTVGEAPWELFFYVCYFECYTNNVYRRASSLALLLNPKDVGWFGASVA